MSPSLDFICHVPGSDWPEPRDAWLHPLLAKTEWLRLLNMRTTSWYKMQTPQYRESYSVADVRSDWVAHILEKAPTHLIKYCPGAVTDENARGSWLAYDSTQLTDAPIGDQAAKLLTLSPTTPGNSPDTLHKLASLTLQQLIQRPDVLLACGIATEDVAALTARAGWEDAARPDTALVRWIIERVLGEQRIQWRDPFPHWLVYYLGQHPPSTLKTQKNKIARLPTLVEALDDEPAPQNADSDEDLPPEENLWPVVLRALESPLEKLARSVAALLLERGHGGQPNTPDFQRQWDAAQPFVFECAKAAVRDPKARVQLFRMQSMGLSLAEMAKQLSVTVANISSYRHHFKGVLQRARAKLWDDWPAGAAGTPLLPPDAQSDLQNRTHQQFIEILRRFRLQAEGQ